MSKKFCWIDKAVQYALIKIESYPDYVFAESELARLSQAGFSFLKELKFLKWKQFDWEHELFVSHLLGDIGTVRYLRQKKDDKYWAYPQEDDDKGRIEVEEKDLPHYIFSIEDLAGEIRKKNDLDQQFSKLSDSLFFVGGKNIADGRVAILFSMDDCDVNFVKELKGVSNVVANYGRHIVLSPTRSISCEKIKSDLGKINLSHAVFSEVLDDDFKLKSDFVFTEVKTGLPTTLHLTGRFESDRHIVMVDNQEGGLTEVNFNLLLQLIIVLKKTQEGWVQSGEGDWQAFGRLKDNFKKVFDGYDFKGLIVNGRKKYRLALMSDNVTYERAKLKKIKLGSSFSDIVNQLPVIRKK